MSCDESSETSPSVWSAAKRGSFDLLRFGGEAALVVEMFCSAAFASTPATFVYRHRDERDPRADRVVAHRRLTARRCAGDRPPRRRNESVALVLSARP